MFRKYWVPTPISTSQTSTSPTWEAMLGHRTYSPDPMAPASSSTLGPSTFFIGSGSGRSAYSTAGTYLSGISVVLMKPPGASVLWSWHLLVRRNGQEVLVLVRQRHLGEQRAALRLTAVGLFLDQPLDELAGHLLAVGERGTGVQPVPHLGAGDLRG